MNDFRSIDVSDMAQVQPASQPAPQLMWLKIEDLVIDDRYQRPLNQSNKAAIKRIASEFRWSRFSPLLVAPVQGGKYALIDGQHRAHAAALCGFETVPAMIALVAPEEQALAFIEVNTRQIRVSGLSLYRAGLTAGEEWAVQCRDAVRAAGCELMLSNRSTKDKKPGMIFAVALIRKLIEAGHATAVTDGLTALKEFEPEAVANFADTLLAPWLTAVSESNAAVPDLVATLRSKRPWLVLELADRVADKDGRPRATARREAFLNLIAQQVSA